MKVFRTTMIVSVLLTAALFAGCGKKEKDAQGESAKEEHSKEDGHGHGEESPSGAGFKAGKGVILTEETRKILGVEVADVEDRKMAEQIRFTAQIFAINHNHPLTETNHAMCSVRGAGFVTSNNSTLVKPGLIVDLLQGTNPSVPAYVVGVQKTLAIGEAEIVVSATNATGLLKSGDFLPARITLPREKEVPTVPASALLRTSEGTFVYAVNGDAYFKTAVKVGDETEDWIEITDGLLAGDQVVTKPVQTLWLIELRATKGGGHSH
jgi:hypothetical protein